MKKFILVYEIIFEKLNKSFYLDRDFRCIFEFRNQKIHQPCNRHLQIVEQDCHILLFFPDRLLHKTQDIQPNHSILPILRLL